MDAPLEAKTATARTFSQAPRIASAWIVTTSLDKPSAETRKFIRSHVMRGKNTIKKNKKCATRKKTRDATCETLSYVPPKLAPEMQSFPMDVRLTPRVRELLYRAFTMIAPPAPVLKGSGDPSSSYLLCFENLVVNPALVNTLLFTAQMYRDTVVDRLAAPSPQAGLYLSLVLTQLGEWLRDQERATSHATVSVIVSLTMAAVFAGDVEAAQKHMDALHAIVSTPEPSTGKGRLFERKAQRIDFGLALASGRTPRFYPPNVSFGPQVASRDPSCFFPELSMIRPRPDPRLLNVWADLRAFADSEEQLRSARSISGSPMLAIIIETAPRRLMALDYGPISVPELLRLCMLVVLKSLVTPLPGIGKMLRYLAHRLKLNIMVVHDACPAEMRPLFLWASVLCALFVYEEEDREWLQRVIRRTAESLGVETWHGFKIIMSRHIWLEAVCEQAGEQLFIDWVAAAP